MAERVSLRLARPLGAAKRLGGFGLSIAIGVLINVTLIPVIVSIAGSGAWAGIAVAQSIAAFGSILIFFGWDATGPSRVASLSVQERGQFFADSLGSRLWLLVCVSPVCLLIVWLLLPEGFLVNGISALAFLVPAVGASWFFVGEGSPSRLILFETVPKASGAIVGAGILIASQDLVLFSLAQLFAAALMVAGGSLNVLRRHPGFVFSVGLVACFRRLRFQVSSILTSGTAALYINFPLVASALWAPLAVDSYALADKLLKFSLTALNPAVQVAQGYVPSKDAAEHARRARRAFRGALLLGSISATGYIAFAPLAGGLLSGRHISIEWSLSAPLGLVLFGYTASAIIGFSCLTSYGEIARVARSTVFGAVIGIPLVTIGALTIGTVGVAWGAAISQVFVAVYLAVYLRRLLNGAGVISGERM